MTTDLARLIAEREPDPDALERERLVRTPEWLGHLPKHSYIDARFYEPFEQMVLGTIGATIEATVRCGR